MNDPQQQQPPPVPGEMGLFEHLAELRKRLIVIAIAVLVTSCFAYEYSTAVFELLSRPYFEAFPGNQLIGTGPAEAFMLKLKVAVFVGVTLASPIIFHQLWMFVAPGLYEHERRLVVPFVLSTTMLFMLGIWFCYNFIFPVAFDFFS